MSGLHGYQANLVLRNMRNELWSQHFRNIFCRMEDVTSGCARFTLVQHDSVADHSPLTRKLNMPWKTELFKGVIEVSYGHFQNFNELKNSYLNNENGCWIFNNCSPLFFSISFTLLSLLCMFYVNLGFY